VTVSSVELTLQVEGEALQAGGEVLILGKVDEGQILEVLGKILGGQLTVQVEVQGEHWGEY
jgi:hypothetical protein